MFVNFNSKIVNVDTINYISTDKLVDHRFISVHFKDGKMEAVENTKAVEVLMRLFPAALEGKRMKFIRNSWAIHNLIGHPLMQICSWLNLTSLGIKIHDATVPLPKVADE